MTAMLQRLIQLAIRSYVRGPARSWLYTSVALWLLGKVRSTVGRQELVDVSALKPGETIVIENLDVSHRRQIRQLKKSAKAERAVLPKKSDKKSDKKSKSASGEDSTAQTGSRWWRFLMRP